MKTNRLFLITFLAGLLGVVLNFPVAAVAESVSTADFITNAAIANQFEIESSKLALDKSQDNHVKRFAQRMIDDHTKKGNELKAVLNSIKSPTNVPTELDDKHQKLLDQLQQASGQDFDRQYVSMQTDAHKEAIGLFTDYSQHGHNRTLRKFATNTLPTLKEHLKHIEKINMAD